jgi:hypothetical protein
MDSTFTTKPIRAALLVAGLALVVRLAFAFVVVPAWEARSGIAPFPDRYPELARNLWSRGILGYEDFPTTTRGPGFALWLVPAVASGIGDARWIGLWSCVPGVVGAALITLCLWRRGSAAAMAAGAIAGCHPVAAFTSSRALADEWYGVLVFVAAVGLLDGGFGASMRAWRAAATAALALALLTRPTAAIAVVAIGIAALVELGDRRRLRGALLLLALIPSLAWSVRSSRLEGRPVFVNSLLAYNFWLGEAQARAPVGAGSGSLRSEALRLMADEGGYAPAKAPGFWYGSLAPPETARMETALTAGALDLIGSHPVRYLGRVVRGLGSFWFQADSLATSLLYGAFLVPLIGLAVLGLVRGARAREGLVVAAFGIVAAHNVFYASTVPAARSAVQLVPLLAFLAGIAIAGRGARSDRL